MESAFGVEHGEFSKKFEKEKSQASAGRYAAGTVFGPFHGAVAGKGAKNKAKAAGTQLGLATVGAAAGPVTSYAGSGVGTHIAHKRGWLKPQKKKD